MAYKFRMFFLLICVSSVLCSNYLANNPSEHAVLQNFTGNKSKQDDIYKSSVVPKTDKQIADAIENFEVRDDDVWICTYPRSGTTWTQEMVWLILNDLDYDGARVPLTQRSPFFEKSKFTLPDETSGEDPLKSIKDTENLPSPRVIKTHLSIHALPRQLREREKRAKIIHVSRNVKDVSVSLYHHHKRFNDGYSGTLEEFSRAFMETRLVYQPYWSHVNGYLAKRGDERMLFLKFEDMKNNLPSQIKKVARFLGKKLNDQQLKILDDHLSFKSMQKNPAVNEEDAIAQACKGDSCKEKFIRQGEVGQWKTAMSKELIQEFDNWIVANSREQ